MPKLQPHIGHATRRRLFPVLATIALLFVVEGVSIYLFRPVVASQPQQQARKTLLPQVLSQTDVALYRRAFALEKTGKSDEADSLLARVSDPLLRGVLVGERYLSRAGDKGPTFCELALWLARYGDHAQANDLYMRARARTPDDASFLTEPQLVATLKSIPGGNDRSVLADEKLWTSGIAAFRDHDAKAAFHDFTALLEEEQLPSDDRAAAAFWAYRAAGASGQNDDASRYLAQAADEAPGFYSILARQISGEGTIVPAAHDSETLASFLTRPPVRRTIALKAIGQEMLAEKEMRALFLTTGRREHALLAQLADLLEMPGAKMRMAVAGEYDSKKNNTAFPVPAWKPTLGYHVEPALLFAIIRQESGFNPHARNASGASGVMQLMPATAHAMARDARVAMSTEPAVSMTLGQHYLEYLMDMTAINDNLVYVLAAYNAGPGSLIAWKKKSARLSEDPLLFIESIPNAETRDYVVHVMGNYWVYSEILGSYENATAKALARNHWPRYERPGRQMVSLLSRRDGAE